MALCRATCAHGGPCTYKARPGYTMCGKHKTQDTIQQAEPCGLLTNLGTCVRPREVGRTMCHEHRVSIEYSEALRRRREIWDRARDTLWDTHNPEEARAVLIRAVADNEIGEDNFNQYMERLEATIVRVADTRVVVANPDLAALAQDKQNIHTHVVNKQTFEGLELLTATPVASRLDTLAELTAAWSGKNARVLADVRKWYDMDTCRNTDDRLYRRALDGLWTRIKASPHHAELTRRLWEECSEALDKCCDGHLARLCNVLVGFDDSVKPLVPKGELLQQRIAAIASKSLDTHLKVGEAWLVFDELGIPMSERVAWLEAL